MNNNSPLDFPDPDILDVIARPKPVQVYKTDINIIAIIDKKRMELNNIEEKAKEYAQQFKVYNAPVGSAIEMGKAEKHFKAGYQSGYSAGRESMSKEIEQKLKAKITEHWKMQDFYTEELEAILKELDPTYEGFM